MKELKTFDLNSFDHNNSTIDGHVRAVGKWLRENQKHKDQYNVVLLYTYEGEIHFNQKDYFLTALNDELNTEWSKDSIFLVMADANLKDNIDRWFAGTSRRSSPLTPIAWPLGLLKRTQQYYSNKSIKQPKAHSNITKRFICMNAAAKQHRAKMVDFLIGTQQQGSISWLNRYGKLNQKQYEFQYWDGSEIKLDYDAKSIDQGHNQDVLPSAYYYAGFEIVNESIVSDTSLFITEKTWKPLMYEKVFVPHGSKGTVTFLKELGFDLFEEELNINYDWDNLPYKERWSALIDTVSKLLEMSIEDWNAFYQRDDIKKKLNKNSTLARTLNIPGWMNQIIAHNEKNR